MIGSTTWARAYALALGILLVAFTVVVLAMALVSLVAGLFDPDRVMRDLDKAALGIAHWHDVLLFVLAGIVGLATWRRAGSARAYALTFGAIFLAFAVFGFLLHRDAWLMPTTLVHDVVAAVVGVLGLAAGLASPRHPPPIRPMASVA